MNRADLKKALRGEITSITIENIKDILKEIKSKLMPLEASLGVKIKIGNVKFDRISFTAKLVGELTNPEGEGSSAEEVKFGRECWLVGLRPSDYNREVILKGDKYEGVKAKLCGVSPNAKKYTLIFRTEKGTIVKATEKVLL